MGRYHFCYIGQPWRFRRVQYPEFNWYWIDFGLWRVWWSHV